MPAARMLASSAASSAAVAGVLRTLAGERTSWLSGMLRTLLLAVMAGDSCDGRARDVSRPVKPVTNPLSALFLLELPVLLPDGKGRGPRRVTPRGRVLPLPAPGRLR